MRFEDVDINKVYYTPTIRYMQLSIYYNFNIENDEHISCDMMEMLIKDLGIYPGMVFTRSENYDLQEASDEIRQLFIRAIFERRLIFN